MPMIVVDVESNVKITRLGIWRSLKLEKLTTGEKINLLYRWVQWDIGVRKKLVRLSVTRHGLGLEIIQSLP